MFVPAQGNQRFNARRFTGFDVLFAVITRVGQELDDSAQALGYSCSLTLYDPIHSIISSAQISPTGC
jgi:hypothetical protein